MGHRRAKLTIRYSPLRYPGGKSKLTNTFKKLIEDNKLESITYVEPFAGGANVALSLLIDGYVSNIIINDIDKAVYSFWFSVLNNTTKLIDKIYNCSIGINEWHRQKQIISNPQNSELELGFALLFLNRTNFSGIINAGPIGGIEQNKEYKINARFNKIDIISKIKTISKFKDRIVLLNLDALNLIETINNNIGACLIYFDPPYYKQGKKLYTNFYNANDHRVLSDSIKQLNVPLVITYDNVEDIKNLYTDFQSREFLINYSANNHTMGKEILFYNNISSCNFLTHLR